MNLKRGPVVAALAIGVGLALAPAIFQMFTRAPGGGKMINAFRPYMNEPTISKYQGYMAEIDRAHQETVNRLPALLQSQAAVQPSAIPARFPSLAQFDAQWPTINEDMSKDMLVKMQRMVPNYKAVDALPPFWMFPWFFVLPGLMVAAVAFIAIRAARTRDGPGGYLVALTALGVAIIAAPVVFQMFTRAPKGAQMINNFKPIMTTKKVTTVQTYFLVMGAGEGQLRTEVEPLLAQHGVGPSQLGAQLPAIARFHHDWPRISNEMAPMIGVMADNVGHFKGVAALPPFWLFPWFFVLPGLLVAGLGWKGRSGMPPAEAVEQPRPSARPAALHRP